MAVNVKMGVDIGGFSAGIREGQAQLKTLKAEMKATESEFKATGNAEQYLANKTKTLNSQMNANRKIIDQSEKALEELAKAGVQPTDEAYQKLYIQLMNAKSGMSEAQAALNGLNGTQQEVASGAGRLADSFNNIGKQVSFKTISEGLDGMLDGLKNVASKAVEVGEIIWNTMLDSAAQADDIATMAKQMDMSIQDVQEYKGVFDTIADTSITDWAKAKRKLQHAIYDPSADQIDALSALGINTHNILGDGKYGAVQGAAKSWEDLFWEVGAELRKRVDNGQMTEDQADVFGEALFGRGFSEFKNLLDMGQEEFNAARKGVNTASDKAIEDAAALNDAIIKLKADFEALKIEIVGAVAPAFTELAEKISNVIIKISDWAKSEEGQQKLRELAEAIGALLGSFSEEDFDTIISGVTAAIDGFTEGLKWLDQNREAVGEALKYIVGTWGTITIGGNLANIMSFVMGIKGVAGAGAVSGAGAAGAAAGSAWGSAFAAAALLAAPWLLALLAKNAIPEEAQLGNEKHVQSVNASKEEIERLIKWVELENEFANIQAKYGTDEFDERRYAEVATQIQQLGDIQNSPLWGAYWEYLVANDLMAGKMPTDVLEKMRDELTNAEPVEVPVKPVLEPDSNFKDELLAWMDEQNPMRGARHSGPGRKRNIVGQAEHIGSGNDPWPKETIEPADLSIQPMLPTGYAISPDLFNGDILGGKWGTVGEAFELPVKPVFKDEDDEDIDIRDLLEDDAVLMPTEPEVDLDSAQKQLTDAGLTVPVTPLLNWGPAPWGSTGGGGAGKDGYVALHANGIWSVPYDGYLASLHRGERVVPAREVASRNYSSNLYVESMYMNNGADANGLAAAMAAAQRRTMNGYGS